MTDTELRQAGDAAPAAPGGPARKPAGKQAGLRRRTFGPDTTKGTIAKIVLLGLVDAVAVYVLMMLFLSQSWGALAVSALVVAAFGKIGAAGVPMPAIPEMSAVWADWGATELALIKGQGNPAADWAKMAASIKAKIAG